ncbi:MAG: CHRD domain-containing protein [SAR202 cluster bacterium]|nr:CHRD domain-containing protein [SAR202 cluster bacterium]
MVTLETPAGIENVYLTGSSMVFVFFPGAEGSAQDHNGDGLEEVQTEMIAMNLVGHSSMGPVIVRESPTLQSLGMLRETVNNVPGTLDVPPFTSVGTVDSFFDIFTELSIDGGANWIPASNQTRIRGTMTHKPAAMNNVFQTDPVFNPPSYGPFRVISIGFRPVTDTSIPNTVNVSGFKFRDDDGNGAMDSGEPGIFGFWVFADVNGNGAFDIGEPTTETGNNGFFTLSGIPNTGVRIYEVQQSGYVQTWPPSGYHQLNTYPPGSELIRHFGNRPETPVGSIVGYKWHDQDGDTFVGTGESYLAGWSIYVDLDNNAALDAAEPYAVTDSNGYYEIHGLAAGAGYYVREQQQHGWEQTFPANGVPHHVASLTIGKTYMDFGNRQLPPDGLISGYKWEDINGDGDWDQADGEAGLAGWRFYADLNNNGFLDSGEPWADTDGTGHYQLTVSMTNLPVIVREQLPAVGWAQTYPAAGYHEAWFQAGPVEEGLNFGNKQLPLASVSGHKWNDLNGDGSQTSSEPMLPGWTIYIDVNNNGELDVDEPVSVTDDGGWFHFVNLALNTTYVVREVHQQFWLQTFPILGMSWQVYLDDTTMEVVNPAAFGNRYLPGQVAGRKWNDLNGDGSQTSSEPMLPGWTIYIDVNNNGELDVDEPVSVTDDGGWFRFMYLPFGATYRIREVQQPGWTQTYPAAGYWEITPTPAQPIFALFAGFGNRRDAQTFAVSGFVFNDTNGNGNWDSGETVIEGIEVCRADESGACVPSGPATTTDSTGWYEMHDLPIEINNCFQVSLPPSAVKTYPASFDDQCFSDVEPGSEVHLTFGIHFETGPTGTISGVKYNDENRNGQRDGEPGLYGWRIYVDLNMNGSWDLNEPYSITNMNGVFTIESVPAGVLVYVREEQQAGWMQTQPLTPGYYDVNLDPGMFLINVQFGNALAPTGGIIYGQKWNDRNHNGVWESGEPPLAGWKIFVDDFAPTGVWTEGELFAITDENGMWMIENVPPGPHSVREVPQDGWFQSYPPRWWSILEGQYVSPTGTTSTARGWGVFNLNPQDNTLHFYVGMQWVASDVTGIHIHRGAVGEVGNVLYDLLAAVDPLQWAIGGPAMGYVQLADIAGEGLTVQQQIDMLENGMLYLDIHTEQYPDGELRNLVGPSHGTHQIDVHAGGAIGGLDFGNFETGDGGQPEDCSCVIGIFEGDQTHDWKLAWTEPTAPTAPVDFRVVASSVNASETGSITVTVVDEAGTQTITVNHPATGDAEGWLHLSLLPHKLYDVTVSFSGTARHYKLGKDNPHLSIGFNSDPRYLEDTDQYWAIRTATGEDVWIELETDPAGVGVPPQSTSATIEIFSASTMATIIGPTTVSLTPGTPTPVGFLGATDDSYVIKITGLNGHFRLRKTSGATDMDKILWMLPCPEGGPKEHKGGIGGFKFNDLNGNGVIDEGDSPLLGVGVYLDLNNDGTWDDGEPGMMTGMDVPSTPGNETGMFFFPGLDAGTYVIREVVQEGWTQTAPAGDGSYVVTLAQGEVRMDLAFGNRMTAPSTGKLGGYKFNDLNNNGVWDNGGPGMPGWQIFIDSNNNGVWDTDERYAYTMVDNPDTEPSELGYWEIGGLPAGDYVIRETQQAGWTVTRPEMGQEMVHLEPGQTFNMLNFGNRLTPVKGSISVFKFKDINNNGMWDEGEPSLPGWTVYLDLNDNGMLDSGEPSMVTMDDNIGTAAVNEAGMYRFADLDAGMYVVREVRQSGWTQTFPMGDGAHRPMVYDGMHLNGMHFGNRPTPVITGMCGDLNGDGQVSILDVIISLQIITMRITATEQQAHLGDIVRDGQLNVGDTIRMLRFLVGIATIEGCGPVGPAPVERVLTGTVMFDASVMPGVTVELKAPAEYEVNTVIMTGLTDSSGVFTLQNAPAGIYTVWAIAPVGQGFWPLAHTSVSLPPTGDEDAGTIYLTKQVTATYPVGVTHEDNPTPTFTWEALDGTADYVVRLRNTGANAEMFGAPVETTSFTFPSQLPVGSYEWQVTARNGVGVAIGRSMTATFTRID